MGIKAKILDDIKLSMKNKESDKLSVLRFIHASIKNKEIECRPNDLKEEDVLAVLKKMAKQRKDATEQYKKAERQDLVDQETYQLQIIESYLPEAMGEDQVKALVEKVVSELGATSMKDMGNVMKTVIAQSGGSADSRMVSELVKAKLQG